MICLQTIGKLPIGSNMVNRQGIAYESSAVSALAVLRFDGQHSGLFPSFASIGGYPAFPKRRLSAAFIFGSIGISTLIRAKARGAFAPHFSAPNLKGLEGKSCSTHFTSKGDSGDKVWIPLARQNGRMSVFRRRTPDLVHSLGVCNAQASLRTESFTLHFVRRNKHNCSADLAGFWLSRVFHSSIISKYARLSNGAGTTGLVAAKLGRSYVGIDLKPEYIEMSRKRINAYAPLLEAAGG